MLMQLILLLLIVFLKEIIVDCYIVVSPVLYVNKSQNV